MKCADGQAASSEKVGHSGHRRKTANVPNCAQLKPLCDKAFEELGTVGTLGTVVSAGGGSNRSKPATKRRGKKGWERIRFGYQEEGVKSCRGTFFAHLLPSIPYPLPLPENLPSKTDLTGRSSRFIP